MLCVINFSVSFQDTIDAGDLLHCNKMFPDGKILAGILEGRLVQMYIFRQSLIGQKVKDQRVRFY